MVAASLFLEDPFFLLKGSRRKQLFVRRNVLEAAGQTPARKQQQQPQLIGVTAFRQTKNVCRCLPELSSEQKIHSRIPITLRSEEPTAQNFVGRARPRGPSWPACRPTDRLAGRRIGPPASEPVCQTVSQSDSRSDKQSLSWSLRKCSVGWLAGWLFHFPKRKIRHGGFN